MINKTLIFVDRLTEDAHQLPLSFLKVGGLTILERQLRQLKKVGISQVYLVSDRLQDMAKAEVGKFKGGPESIQIIKDISEGDEHWGEHESLFIIEEGRMVDQRIMRAVINSSMPNVLSFFNEDALLVGISKAKKVTIEDKDLIFASVLRIRGDILKRSSLDKEFLSSPILSLLGNFESGMGFDKIKAIDIKKYVPNLRRNLDVLWRPIEKASDCNKITKLLISRAQKGTQDAISRWVYPIPENFLTEHLLKTPLQGMVLRGLIFLFGVYLTWLFAIGHMGWGLAGVIILGIFFGVEEKSSQILLQERSKIKISANIFKVVEYSWMFAIAFYMAKMTGNQALWAVGLLIILFDIIMGLQKSFYRRISGHSLDDAGSFEKSFKLLGAMRNTRVWLLIPFALIEKWELGFWVIAIYTVGSFFTIQYRFFKRLVEKLSPSETQP